MTNQKIDDTKDEGKKRTADNEFDLTIIGAGGAGLAAAMYAARLDLKTLCLGSASSSELSLGGVITTTNLVENYPGFIRLTGTELANKIKEHAISYPLVNLKEERVISIDKEKDKFIIKTKKNNYLTKALIFATGSKWKKLEVPGGTEFENRGVAYCALCDAPLYRNKIVAIVGGSDSAAKDALVLAEHAKQVYIIARGNKIRAEPPNMRRVEANKKITIILNTNILEVKGDSAVRFVVFDKPYKGNKELALDGVFVAIGHIPLSDLAKPLGVKINDHGEIIIDHKTCETNIAGIFAAGDVADKPFKQLITGVAEGCTAAYSAFQYISKNNI